MNKVPLVEFRHTTLQIIDGDRSGNYPKKKEFARTGFCVFLNTNNVTSSGFDFSRVDYISKERDELLRKGKARRNDIVLTTRGTVGNVAFYGDSVPFKNIRINSGMVLLRTDQSTIDPYYLYAFLRSALFRKQVISNGSGSAQPQLPITALRNISLPTPHFYKQQKIAAVLSALDAKIDLNNRINRELEALAKTIYDYWFVQFDFPDGHGRPYKSSGGAMVWNDTLKRDIPAGWGAGTLSDALRLEYGKPLKDSDRAGSGYPVMGSNGIVGYHDDYLVEGPGIVVGRKGSAGAITFSHENFFPIDTTFYVKPNADYGFMFLHQLLLRLPLAKLNGDSAVPGLNRESAHRLPVILPPIVIAREFEVTSTAFARKENAALNENRELTRLRDWLLPLLMNGQVRVT